MSSVTSLLVVANISVCLIGTKARVNASMTFLRLHPPRPNDHPCNCNGKEKITSKTLIC